jgi:hypothetical protein
MAILLDLISLLNAANCRSNKTRLSFSEQPCFFDCLPCVLTCLCYSAGPGMLAAHTKLSGYSLVLMLCVVSLAQYKSNVGGNRLQ